MNNITCLYPDREAVLVAYLYDEIDAAGRVAFETHVATCLVCRSELAELRQARATLGQWASPEPAHAFTFEPRVAGPGRGAWWHDVPAWAQVAAAMLVLGLSASIANLDIRYDRAHGLNVTTGWAKPAAAATPQAQPAQADNAAPWRADLAALQTQLRSEIRAQSSTAQASPAVPAAGAISDAELRRRVRVLLDESEKKQEKELALRLVQLQNDFYAQRQADLTKINQSIGYIQNAYGSTYGDLRNYVIRAAQTR